MLAACEPQAAAPVTATQRAAAAAEAGYHPPPEIVGVLREADTLKLSGRAAPGAQVRLAEPGGQAVAAEANGKGLWSIEIPQASHARVFGLSMTAEGRITRAQAYVLATPEGEIAELRAGAGAALLAAGGPARLTTVDFDQGGGAIVSAVTPPGAEVSLLLDARSAGMGRADAAGRLFVALTRPLQPGRRMLSMRGDGDAFEASDQVEVSPAAPLNGAVFRSVRTGDSLRVDWLTPGGGVQSTILLQAGEARP